MSFTSPLFLTIILCLLLFCAIAVLVYINLKDLKKRKEIEGLVLELAKEKDGVLNASDLSVNLDFNTNESENLLRHMARSNFATVDIKPDGKAAYLFRDLIKKYEEGEKEEE